MASSDSNPGPRWTRHYEEAARRRRARGWHRRDASSAGRKRDDRVRLYVVAGALFVALTLVAMFLPR